MLVLCAPVISYILTYCNIDELLICSCVSQLVRQYAGDAMKIIVRTLIRRYFQQLSGPLDLSSRQFWHAAHRMTKDHILVVCGISTYSFIPSTRQWIRRADCRRDRSEHSMAYFQGEVFAVSTRSEIAAGTVESYSMALDLWTTQPALPERMPGAACVVVNDRLCCAGKATGGAGPTLSYALRNGSWEKLTNKDLPMSRIVDRCRDPRTISPEVLAHNDYHRSALVVEVLSALHFENSRILLCDGKHYVVIWPDAAIALAQPWEGNFMYIFNLCDFTLTTAATMVVYDTKIYMFGLTDAAHPGRLLWDAFDVRTRRWLSKEAGLSPVDRLMPQDLLAHGAAAVYPGASFKWT